MRAAVDFDACPEGQLKCSECNVSVNGTDELSKHYNNKHDPLPSYVCGEADCKKRFIDKNSMIRHISTYHIAKRAEVTVNRVVPDIAAAGSSRQDHCSRPANLALCGNDECDNEVPTDANAGSIEVSVQQTVNNSAVQVLLNMRSTASLSGQAVERFEQGCSQLLENYIDAVKEKLSARLIEKGVDAAEVADVLKELDIKDPFENLKSIDDQLEYFSAEFGLAKPESKFLDTRIDKRLDPESSAYIPTQVNESFQYVSVIATLKAILSKKSARDKIFHDYRSKDGVIRSYADGSHCRNHPFISKHENVIPILLFYDELEVANALGSKTIIHKLGAFFYQLLNLPPEESSELSSIHLLSLVNADDMKKPGAFKKVLAPFVEEMKQLSTDEGVKLEVDGEEIVIRAVLVALTADTLAAHDVLGFLSVGARHFCRKCLVSRAEVRANANSVGEMRTIEGHCEHLRKIAERASYSTECGVKGDSPLNEVPYFHCVNNSVFDCFHDLCEGVVPLVVRSVLHEFINRKEFLTVSDLNSRIASFSYGYPDAKNKPSPNFTSAMLSSNKGKLKQTGSQMWCLMRSLPFLLGDTIPLGNDHMEIIFLLQDIMNIMFSFQIREDDIDRMDGLIAQHNELFEKLFIHEVEEEVEGDDDDDQEQADEVDNPDEIGEESMNTTEETAPSAEEENENRDEENSSSVEEMSEEAERRPTRKSKKTPARLKVHITNKLHHLKHYAQMIREFGNPVRYWCAKFEGRLKIFRQHAAVCCNFRNTPMTMAKMFQLSNLHSIIGNKTKNEVEHLKGKLVQFSGLIEHSQLLLEAGIKEGDQILYTDGATVRGEEYRPGLFVTLESSRRGPQFGIIMKVIVYHGDVLLVVKRWRNDGVCQRMNAFKVSSAHPNQRNLHVVVRVKSLANFRCIAPWTTNDNDVFLSPRTVLM